MLRGKLRSLKDKLGIVEKQPEKKEVKVVEKEEKKSKKKTMKTLKTILGLVLVFGLVAGGIVLADTINNFYGPATITQTDNGGDAMVGAAAGPDKYFQQHFHEGFIDGGKVLDASSSMTYGFTLTAAQICDNAVIEVTPLTGLADASLDITLPATSTLFGYCLRNPGDKKSFLFFNNSATAASTTQIVAGTGMHLMEPTGGDVLVDGQHGAMITITRFDMGVLDVYAVVTDHIEAD